MHMDEKKKVEDLLQLSHVHTFIKCFTTGLIHLRQNMVARAWRKWISFQQEKISKELAKKHHLRNLVKHLHLHSNRQLGVYFRRWNVIVTDIKGAAESSRLKTEMKEKDQHHMGCATNVSCVCLYNYLLFNFLSPSRTSIWPLIRAHQIKYIRGRIGHKINGA